MMRTFVEIIRIINISRRRHINEPEIGRFYLNRKGVYQRTDKILANITKDNQLEYNGRGLLCYADHDPMIDSVESELIRQGVWTVEQVGHLWIFANNINYFLAKISPMGIDIITSGHIINGEKAMVNIITKKEDLRPFKGKVEKDDLELDL